MPRPLQSSLNPMMKNNLGLYLEVAPTISCFFVCKFLSLFFYGPHVRMKRRLLCQHVLRQSLKVDQTTNPSHSGQDIPFFIRKFMNKKLTCLFSKTTALKFECKHNLVPRVSPLYAPGSERGETLVGAGHVSPKIWEITNK